MWSKNRKRATQTPLGDGCLQEEIVQQRKTRQETSVVVQEHGLPEGILAILHLLPCPLQDETGAVWDHPLRNDAELSAIAAHALYVSLWQGEAYLSQQLLLLERKGLDLPKVVLLQGQRLKADARTCMGVYWARRDLRLLNLFSSWRDDLGGSRWERMLSQSSPNLYRPIVNRLKVRRKQGVLVLSRGEDGPVSLLD